VQVTTRHRTVNGFISISPRCKRISIISSTSDSECTICLSNDCKQEETNKATIRIVIALSGLFQDWQMSWLMWKGNSHVETFKTKNLHFPESFEQYIKVMCCFIEDDLWIEASRQGMW